MIPFSNRYSRYSTCRFVTLCVSDNFHSQCILSCSIVLASYMSRNIVMNIGLFEYM